MLFFGAGDRTRNQAHARCVIIVRLNSPYLSQSEREIFAMQNGEFLLGICEVQILQLGLASEAGQVVTRQKKSTARMLFFWCGRQDLNLHGGTHQILSLARLPIPPRPQISRLVKTGCIVVFIFFIAI